MTPVLTLTLVLSSTLGAISFACTFFNELFFAQFALMGSFILGLLAALIDALQDADKLRPTRPLTPTERRRLEALVASRRPAAGNGNAIATPSGTFVPLQTVKVVSDNTCLYRINTDIHG